MTSPLVTLPDGTVIRPARTSDVRGIHALVDEYVNDRRLLAKATVELYEHVQEFLRSEEHTSELQSLAYPRMPSSA